MDNDTVDFSNDRTSQNLGTKGFVVAIGTGAARVAGLIRDIVLSSFFGASEFADAFYLAFRIPNFFRRLLAEGAFAQAFVPILSEYRTRGPKSAVNEFVSVVSGNFTAVLTGICVLGVAGAPVLVFLFTVGGWQNDPRLDLAVNMVRIMFPYLGFISLTAFAGALLNSYDRYAVPAFTPVLLNVCLIAAALFATEYFAEPIFAIAWGVFAAGILQLLFQFPSLQRLKFILPPRFDMRHEGVCKMLRLMGPGVLAASAGQINILIGTILASQLMLGSVSWLWYADRFLALPIGLVAITLRTVMLPNLSRLHARVDNEGFSRTIDWGVRVGLLLGAPAAVALYVLADPIIATIYHRGAFTTADIVMSSAALQAYAIGILPMVLVMVAAPAYFARQDTMVPFRYAAVSVGVNIFTCIALFWWLGHVGIAYGTSVAAFVNIYLLMRGILRDGRYRPGKALFHAIGTSVISCIAMIVLVIYLDPGFMFWSTASEGDRIIEIGTIVAAGFGAYVLMCACLGMRPRHLLHHV